jgi:hypothetical protein
MDILVFGGICFGMCLVACGFSLARHFCPHR